MKSFLPLRLFIQLILCFLIFGSAFADGEGSAGNAEPFIPEGIEQQEIPPYTIFGSDDRIIITKVPANFPYTAVVKLYTEFPAEDGSGSVYTNNCSGAMIGSSYAVTAAHCVYQSNKGYTGSKDYEGWAASIKVCPGTVGGDEPFGCAYVTDKMVMDPKVPEDHDVALLKLDKPLGDQTGWMGSYMLKDEECQSPAQLLGYAPDQNDANPNRELKYMFYSTGYLKGTAHQGKLLKYQMDSLEGSSGGPVIIKYNDLWGYLVGINVSSNRFNNYAVRLTQEVYDFLAPFWGK